MRLMRASSQVPSYTCPPLLLLSLPRPAIEASLQTQPGFVPVGQKALDAHIGQRVVEHLLQHREGNGADVGAN